MQNELTNTELRRATPSDAAAVRDLTRAAYAKWVPVIGREPMPMRMDYDAAVRDHLVDLLYVDGRLAALIEMIPGADHLLIENVAVSPAFQGRGIGRRLMAHAEALAASLGLPEVRLYTNKDFATNLRLYLRLGYQLNREQPFMGGTTVYMSKRLSGASPSEANMRTALKGSCLCGAIRYRVERLETPIEHCHCVTCRKAHAAAYASTARVMRDRFRWTDGEERLTSYESSPGKLRRFCSTCGTHLIADRLAQPHVILRVATLDDDPKTKPVMHIWTSHDAPWLADDEGTLRHPEWPPGR